MPTPFPQLLTPPTAFPADTVRPPPVSAPDAGEWTARVPRLLAAWQRILGPLPRPAAPETTVIDTVDLPTHRRQLLTYFSSPGEQVRAYLLTPTPLTAPRPAVVVFHPTTFDTIREPVGLAGPVSRHTGVHLVEQGFVVLCPENFLWHYRDWRPSDATHWRTEFATLMTRVAAAHPAATGMGKMLADAQRALDVLSRAPGVDPHRLGAFGFSLGAKEVLYLAAFDPRLRAAVSVDGGIGIRYSNWGDPWYLGPQANAPEFGHDHHELLALAAPCAFLLAGSTGGLDEETGRTVEGYDGERSWPYLAAAQPAYAALGASPRLGMLAHAHGHSLPSTLRDTTLKWFRHWLLAKP